MREFHVDGRTFSGYLATPRQGSGPGVVVLHTWWGLTEPFRRGFDRLPGGGLVGFSPQLFPRQKTRVAQGTKEFGSEVGRKEGRGGGGILGLAEGLRQKG